MRSTTGENGERVAVRQVSLCAVPLPKFLALTLTNWDRLWPNENSMSELALPA